MESMVENNFNFWQGKRVLITGHTGFKGAWLTLWLRMLGAKVWGFSLEVDTYPSLFEELNTDDNEFFKKNFSHNIGDILDQKKLNKVIEDCKPEVVFHLAAQA